MCVRILENAEPGSDVPREEPNDLRSRATSHSQTYLAGRPFEDRGRIFVADVDLRTIKEVDMKGGPVVAAFPSVALVSTITAT